jgi:hypothetical protein
LNQRPPAYETGKLPLLYPAKCEPLTRSRVSLFSVHLTHNIRTFGRLSTRIDRVYGSDLCYIGSLQRPQAQPIPHAPSPGYLRTTLFAQIIIHPSSNFLFFSFSASTFFWRSTMIFMAVSISPRSSGNSMYFGNVSAMNKAKPARSVSFFSAIRTSTIFPLKMRAFHPLGLEIIWCNPKTRIQPTYLQNNSQHGSILVEKLVGKGPIGDRSPIGSWAGISPTKYNHYSSPFLHSASNASISIFIVGCRLKIRKYSLKSALCASTFSW